MNIWTRASLAEETLNKVWKYLSTKGMYGRESASILFIRVVVRNKIEMLHETEKSRNESLCLFDGFFHTGASNMNRAADTFISSLRRSPRGSNWNVNITDFSK